MPGAVDWEEVGCPWLGRLLSMHSHSQDHPATYVPQPLCLPPCGLAHSTLIFVLETLVVVRPLVRRCRCWASTQWKPALQGGRGQNKVAAGLVDHLTLPERAATSPQCFSGMCLGPRRDPPGSVYRGRAWGCLASLMSITQPHSCLPSRALPEPQHGLWTSFPMDSE